MSINIAIQTSSQARIAPDPKLPALEHGPSLVASEAQRASLSTSALLEAVVNIVAARLYPRRDGLGYVRALVLAHPEYHQAVCLSDEFPFAVEPGQKVRIRGRPGKYRGKSQIKFEARDIALVAQAADNPDLVCIEATVGRVSIQTPEQAWKAFRMSSGGYESASGDIPFGIHDGQRLRLQGFKSVYNDKPQLLVCRAEPLGVEYADDRRRIFSEFKIPGDYCDRLDAALGPDFAARVIADPELIGSTLRRTRTATRAKIKEACARIEAQNAFAASLRKCGVAEQTVAALTAKHPHGLARVTAYDLIDHGLLDEDRPRGPRRGLTCGEADKLAQSEYALSFRPFDPQSLERAKCFVEHLARERIELRGDIGAPISRVTADLEKRFAIRTTVAEKAVALMVEELAYRLDPSRPDHIWLPREVRAETAIVESVGARSKRTSLSRRVGKTVTLFPTSSARLIELTQAQRDAANMMLEKGVSIVCGPPGVGKTSVLAAIVKHGGDRVLITALAAAAAQRAKEVTGGQAMTIASLTTEGKNSGPVARPDRLVGVDTLIVDEASMVGSRQLAALLEGADKAGVVRVVLCGDPDQLPPIMPGSPFVDLINSGVVPTARLTTIFRTEAGSAVQALVEAMRTGAFTSASGQTFGEGVEFLDGVMGGAAAIVSKYLELASIYGEDNVAVLSPFKGEEHGVHALNASLRAALGATSPHPRVGEILMCVENWSADDGGDGLRLLNGMRLVVTEFDGKWITFRRVSSGETATVPYRPHPYGPAETLVWGRAATVHKYQGSEAEAVIMVIPPGALRLIEKEPHIFDASNFYTGVSRAKKRVVIMGALDQLSALMKHGTRRRITTLERTLREARHD
jgi:AAA domain/UvrD-like helicase C-terminal domain